MAGEQSDGGDGGAVPVQQEPAHPKPIVAVAEDAGAGPSDSTTQASKLRHLSLSAQTIHADDFLNSHQSVAPPMHVSTTFRYNRDPDQLRPWTNINPNNSYDSHVYSRDTAPNTTRLEAVLTSILGGPCLTYSSGLAAFHALVVFLNPKRIAIRGGYHGCHGVIALVAKLTGLEAVDLDAAETALGAGDVIHVETPVNPTGEARDLAAYAATARRLGCVLTVDATFAPPPLLEPFRWGADVVMHSGTKYFGGHSDLLCGVLAVAPQRAGWARGLRDERLVLGSVMGSFEGWLGLRSLRTLELRVRKQSADAERLVGWLAAQVGTGSAAGRVVARVRHASLQAAADPAAAGWLREQMPAGFGPVFAVQLQDADEARRLPSRLELFQHATSLGGVESLVEWRAMTDRTVDRRLLRFSIGLEGFDDLRDDLARGFERLPPNPPALCRASAPDSALRPLKLAAWELRRRARRRRMATLLTVLLLLAAVALPFYVVYKPPAALIAYFARRWPDVLWEVRTDQKIVALTIDDAPSERTQEILGVLNGHEATATFFVIGGQVPGREETLADVVRSGSELGNHAMHDEPSRALPDAELAAQIDAVRRHIRQAYLTAAAPARTGGEEEPIAMPPQYFRPGSGFFSDRMRRLVDRLGYRLVLGSVYPHDPQIGWAWLNARHILSMVRPGAIIVCHDRRPWTAPMLRRVLRQLKKDGYRVVSLTELIEATQQDR
ncbi:cystathionine beta-lyase [Durotheca rogersii]|uniref:cystathionine beta-lyase n=1 Tax=Durotheca rogersii TaxID=419775 RepID=UPI00221F410A|nr:cystathionine beta-lyase [Durotheca rogersii]KAI5866442.1 cystathionine beta-lyase [Durotheca rogersii]